MRHAATQRTLVGGAGIFANESLAGVCKPVHEMGVEQIKLHEQGVDGERHVAGACARSCEKQHHRHYAQAAQEDVAVDAEKTSQTAQHLLDAWGISEGFLAHHSGGEKCGKDEATPLCRKCA